MSPKAQERLAFWLGQTITAFIAFGSIWIASRIGYEEAVRHAQYEDVRRTRNRIRELDRELETNEHALNQALEDWDSDAFRRFALDSHAYDRARESDEYFLLDPETMAALSRAYAPWIRKSIEGIREQGGGPPFRTYALNLTLLLERIEAARPLLRRDLDRIELELVDLRRGRSEVTTQPLGWPPPDPTKWSDDEQAVARSAASPGWQRGIGEKYSGPLQEMGIALYATVPVARRGPTVLQWSRSILPEGRTPARLWLCFSNRAPFERGFHPKRDEEALRRIYSFDVPGDPLVLRIAVDSLVTEIVDPNAPLGWRWVYGFLEDNAGQRYPLRHIEAWKIGSEGAWKFQREAPVNAIVLPRTDAP